MDNLDIANSADDALAVLALLVDSPEMQRAVLRSIPKYGEADDMLIRRAKAWVTDTSKAHRASIAYLAQALTQLEVLRQLMDREGGKR